MTMKERQILFSAPMIRAILEGRKTQTRRAINPQPEFSQLYEHKGKCLYDGENRRWCWNMCPYGKPGDRLYAKETFALHPTMKELGHPAVFYRANDTILPGNKWRPSIFMPRWASRITLELEGVRVERLQEISENDAAAEGCHLDCMSPTGDDNGSFIWGPSGYKALWESISGTGSWDLNPWVWVATFKRVKP